MKIKKGFALRNIAGCEIVVPVGAASDSFNGICRTAPAEL